MSEETNTWLPHRRSTRRKAATRTVRLGDALMAAFSVSDNQTLKEMNDGSLSNPGRPMRQPKTSAVLTVGDGRGFVVASKRRPGHRYVITAAHCLPRQPPAHPAMYLEEKTFDKLLAPLKKKPRVWAECLFADPVADIAVLGPPDGGELFDELVAYETLVSRAARQHVGIILPARPTPGLVLSLEGEWLGCTIQQRNGHLWITEHADIVMFGMSGSPILRHCDWTGLDWHIR